MSKTKFLWSMHYFRAFAIINIVIVHLWRIPLKTNDGMGNQEIIRGVLFNNSTIYFIFIMGFLFFYLKNNFSIHNYYSKKFNFVIVPYLFNVILVWLAFYGLKSYGIYSYATLDTNLLLSVIKGSITPHLWYIPFVSLIYLISPFILKIPRTVFINYIPILFLVPLLGTRTGAEITVGQYLYFLPIYLLGMYVAMNYEKTIAILKKLRILCYATSILTSVIIFVCYKVYQHGEVKQLQHSLFYIQKLAIIGSILPLLHTVTSNTSQILNKIASMSFAIYFIHYTLGRLQEPLLFRILEEYVHTDFWGLASFLFPILIIAQCIVILFFVKKLLGTNSKYILGY